MKEIVLEEIDASARMTELCRIDKRLGYHSEAEGFKFFPKKLEARIDQLRLLLKTEFVEIYDRISKGLPPLEFYLALENGKHPEDTYFTKDGVGEWRKLPDTEHAFRIKHSPDTLTVEINAKASSGVVLGFEFEPLVTTPTITLNKNGEIGFVSQALSHQSLFGEAIEREKEKYSVTVAERDGGLRYTVSMLRSDFAWTSNTPFRIRMRVGGAPLKKSKIGLRLLAKWDEYPDTHVWVVPKS